jgi:hypothetical protein
MLQFGWAGSKKLLALSRLGKKKDPQPGSQGHQVQLQRVFMR